MRSLIGFFIFLFIAVPVSAQTIQGQEDPAYMSAQAQWLEGDDVNSLPALAALAEGGNTAAQVLLALIDKHVHLRPHPSAFTEDDLNVILRQSGGMSGASWMYAAAETDLTAQLWVALWDVDAGVEVVQGFAQLNERRATRVTLQTLLRRQRYREIVQAYEMGLISPNMTWIAVDAHDAINHDGPRPATPSVLLMDGDQTAHLLGLCEHACPTDGIRCVNALTAALGGPFGLVQVGSPSQALIPSYTYGRTPRGRASLLSMARAASLLIGSNSRIMAAEGHSQCVADLLRGE